MLLYRAGLQADLGLPRLQFCARARRLPVQWLVHGPLGGTKVAASTKVTGYLECYAQWSASIGLVVADGCDGMGTVSGGGVIAAGKKVSVSATAPKNWMFVGWASPSDFNSKDNTVRLTMVSTDAKYTFIMPSPGEEADEVELTAVFTHVFGSAIVPDDEIEE